MGGQALTEYRRRLYLHGFIFLLALAAIGLATAGGLGVVSRSLVSTASRANIPPNPYQPSINYLRPGAFLTTLQGAYLQIDAGLLAAQEEAAAEPTPSGETAPAPTSTPAPTPALEVISEAATPPPYFTYTVQPGDTVAGIAARYGIQPDYIFWNNPEVQGDPNLLLVGQEIVIPSVDGIIYAVKLGDTLSDVAAFYQIDVESIVAFAPNGLSSADAIREGMVLLLPGAVPPPPPPPPSPAPALQPAAAPAPAPQPAPASASGYIWPFVGPVTSGFYEPRGSGIHAAIDIDAFGSCGAPVVAAASGTVVLAGWDAGGLGNRVVIRHADGSETLYAHLTDIYIDYGQTVAQGEVIGTVGSTGYSTGCHLHFGLYIGGVAVDPLAYLP